MEAALIGLAGVLVGALLAEHFRRRNRIEPYSQKVFDRRLEIYEGLMTKVQEAYSTVSSMLDADNGLSTDENSAAIFVAGLEVAEYVDANVLYIDSYVASEASAMTLGASEIPSSTGKSRAEMEKDFRSSYKRVKQLIIEESGVAQVNQHFRTVSKSRPGSPLIRRIQVLEKNRDA